MTHHNSLLNQPLSMPPVAYRLKDAAALVGISPDAMLKMIATGQLKARRISPTGTGQRHLTMVPHAELVRLFGVE